MMYRKHLCSPSCLSPAVVHELVHSAVSLQDSERLTADNKTFVSPLAMAIWHTGMATKDGRLNVSPQDTAGTLMTGHFRCIWQLLKAKCRLSTDDLSKLEADLLTGRNALMQHKVTALRWRCYFNSARSRILVHKA